MKVIVNGKKTYLKVGRPTRPTMLKIGAKDKTIIKGVGGKKTTVRVVQDSYKLIQVGIQGPPGPQGDAGADGIGSREYKLTLLSGQTKQVEEFTSDVRVRKWIVDLAPVDDIESAQCFEISAKILANTVDYSKYALLGPRISHSIQFIKSQQDVALVMTNNHSETIDAVIRVIA